MKYIQKLYLLVLLFLISGCSSNVGDEQKHPEDSATSFAASFDFQPEAPRNGKLLGIIELSYSGFNSFVVEIDEQDRWSLEKAVYEESFIEQGKITLDHVLSRLTYFKSEMSKLGLNENDINLVVSSSAYKNQKVKEITDQLRALNIGLISINPEQEAAYAFYATVPKNLGDKSFLIDIGSGSSKISWVENGQVVAVETYGSKHYLQDISEIDVYHAMKEALAQIPAQSKSLCFLVGGTAYQLAKTTDARAGRYTILEHPDKYQSLKEQKLAGLSIYNALWSEATYNYIFDWDANFTIGILMNVN